jgi:hypothetical protein
MNKLYSVFGHRLVDEMARQKGCANPFVLEDGRVYYTSKLIDHGEGEWRYQTWDKSWDPSKDPAAIKVLQDNGILPVDFPLNGVTEGD